MRLRGEAPLAARKAGARIFTAAGFTFIGSFAFVYALRYLPFAEVVAIAFAGPHVHDPVRTLFSSASRSAGTASAQS